MKIVEKETQLIFISRILCHGFRDGPGAIINNEGRKALFQKGDYNVIVVDWSKGADTVNYIEATIRVPQVGEQIAKLTNYIVNLYAETRLNQFGFIGHSLGAHVVGFAGKNVQNGKIPFISNYFKKLINIINLN